MAELHQVAIVQADGGDAAVTCCVHDAGRAGTDAQTVDHLLESVDFTLDVEGAVFDGCQDQVTGGLQGAAADGFVARADHHFVDASRSCFAGFAKTGLHTGLGLQLQGNVFQHVARPGALFQALQKSPAFAHAAAVLDHARQPRRQALVKPRQGIGGKVFQVTNVDQCLHDRTVCPDVGTAQMGHAQKLDGFGVHE